MPVKIFSATAGEIPALEKKINEWMDSLEPGAVRQVTTVGNQGGPQIVITIWYTQVKDKN